jgi:flagellar basal body P-ring formation protein FlgA
MKTLTSSPHEKRKAILTIGLVSMKSIFFALIIGLSLLLATHANAAALRELAVVNDDVIRVNDLFDGVTRNGEAVVGHAPAPGKEIAVNARMLNRVANTYNINWSPRTGNETITVRRDAHIIDTKMIEQSVRDALAEKGLAGSYALTLNSPDIRFVIPADLPATVAVTDLDYTAGREVFTATVVAPSRDNPVKTMTISGQVARSISVPTLSRNMRRGEMISMNDIQFVDMPERLIARDQILDADQLVGMTPARVLTSGRPIKESDITAPQLISRGDDITIQYNVGGMILTAKGRALDNGAKGEFVRVTNLSSAKQLQGEVTASRTVTVY